jgi:hypothetical protein
MGHGETAKWLYQQAQAKAALQSEGRSGDVRDALTSRHVGDAENGALDEALSHTGASAARCVIFRAAEPLCLRCVRLTSAEACSDAIFLCDSAAHDQPSLHFM